MRRLAVHLALAGATALALVAVPFTAPADATPGFGCTPIFNGGLVAEVCTSAMDAQAQGTLVGFTGMLVVNSLRLSKCNAAGTTCTLLAQTTTLSTPKVPTKLGKYYRTCADFRIDVSPTQSFFYYGCSPLVQAPA